MAFNPDRQSIDISINDIANIPFNMEKAIEHVFNNEYALIIGSEVILNKEIEPTGDVNKFLLTQINKILKSNHLSFDELMNHTGIEIDPIRNLLLSEKFKKSMQIEDISLELNGFLRTKLFKTVITTTFDGYLEILMRDIWGDRLQVVNIWDKSSIDNFIERTKLYHEIEQYNEPTLIYAFGKCQESESLLYAKKDFEYIQTIERWLSFNKHTNPLMRFILNKRLLSLGCKFDDWYFRFFWYILRRDELRQRNGDIAITFNEADNSDKKLKAYLKNCRVITETETSARDFMKSFIDAVTSLDDSNIYRDKVLSFRRRGVIFLSYCTKDEDLAINLYQIISPLYPKMWFDQSKILGGDNYDSEIYSGIEQAKVFVILLTKTIANDLSAGRTDNYYNKEWRLAAQRGSKLKVIPLAMDGFDKTQDYYKTIESIFGRPISCVDLEKLNDNNGIKKIQLSIDKVLFD